MADAGDFQSDRPLVSTAEDASDRGRFVVDVDGFAGPLDLLLTLAREQKVDLRQISILALAEQYLGYVAALHRANLELAAEYLVMAAWLAFLKSRLLLPEMPADDGPSGPELAEALRFQLRRLEAMRTAGTRLLARPQLGRDVFLRGRPEGLPAPVVATYRIGLHELLAAYARHLRRRLEPEALRIEPSQLWSLEQALERMRRALGYAPSWEALTRYLPPGTLEGVRAGDLTARSALAATFAASLELAKQGAILLRQHRAFGAIYLKATTAMEAE